MKTHLSALLVLVAGALQPPLVHAQTDAVEPAESEPPADASQEERTARAVARDERSVTFEVGAGVRYDSNVALLEIDTSTNVGDALAVAEFGLGYNLPNTGRFDLTAGYNFSETLHEDFDAFDLRLHRGSSALSWDLGRVDVGAILQYAKAELDGAEFMTLRQVSPYVSTLAGRKLFLRFAYTGTNKDYDRNPLRKASADSWSADVYFFLNGVKTYLLLGLRRDDEDAIDAQFDYRGDRLRVQISHRFALRERELTFKAGVRSETRDYLNLTPSIAAPRDDRRVRFEASAALPLGERVVADFAYQRANNESNLPAVDFNEHLVSLTFTASF